MFERDASNSRSPAPLVNEVLAASVFGTSSKSVESESSQTELGNQRHTLPEPVAFHYTQTDSFVSLLQQLRATLVVSTYQANKLLAVRASGNGLSTLVRTFDKPMGLAIDGSRLAIGTRKEVWLLRNAPDIAPQVEPIGMHDACFLPRSCHITGDIGIHEIAYAGEQLWIVSTRFSCLATLDPDYSFVPRWRPKIAAISMAWQFWTGNQGM